MAAVALVDLFALGVAQVRNDVAASVAKARPGEHARRVLGTVAAVRQCPTPVELEAVELVAQPEVDDTGNGV